MAAKPKAKMKYPRKLRHTLEKVVEKRDEREEREAKLEAESRKALASMSLWMQFMWKGCAKTMYARLGDDLENPHIDTRVEIDTPGFPKPLKMIRHIYGLPPWLRKETPPAE